MKDRFKDIVSNYREPVLRVNKGREYLQEIILYLLYKQGVSSHLIFEGGTALRLIYNLRRFSEDLDFSQLKEIDYGKIEKKLKKELLLMNYNITTNLKERKNVVIINIKFTELYELLRLPYKKQVSIHIEIDKNPPHGGSIKASLVGNEFFSRIYHYKLSSLFSKKLHAIFFREYEKGRDFYDLLWYLKKRVKPDFEFLYNATFQTNPEKADELQKSGWIKYLKNRIDTVDFKKIRKDVAPFLENIDELEFINKDDILSILNY